MEQVGHGLPVDVSRVRGQRRVDVGVGVHPHDAQLPDCRRVTVDRADRQTEDGNQKQDVSLCLMKRGGCWDMMTCRQNI